MKNALSSSTSLLSECPNWIPTKYVFGVHLPGLSQRSSAPGPCLFIPMLTHACLVKAVREALSRAGMDTTGYSGHSFHIGAATTAAQADLPASLSQSLGGTGKTRNEERKNWKREMGNGKREWV